MQQSLGLKLPLDSYLLKPVQRISKYQLIFKELNKCCSSNEKPIVDLALETMLDVVNNLNDVMHASFIVGFNELKSQGRLLKRDQLQMSKLKRNKQSSAMNMVNRLKLNETNKSIDLFLFEKCIVICKRKNDEPYLPNHHLASNSNVNTNANIVPNLPLQQQQQQQQHNSASPSSNNSLSSNSSLPCTAPVNNAQFNFQYFYQFKELLKV